MDILRISGLLEGVTVEVSMLEGSTVGLLSLFSNPKKARTSGFFNNDFCKVIDKHKQKLVRYI